MIFSIILDLIGILGLLGLGVCVLTCLPDPAALSILKHINARGQGTAGA